MPMIYVKKELYDEIVKQGKDPSEYVNRAVEDKLRRTKLAREMKRE